MRMLAILDLDMSRTLLRFLSSSLVAVIAVTFGVSAVHAQSSDALSDLGIFDIGQTLSLPDTDPHAFAVMLINQVLSFLGILALIVFLWGGFLYMFSGGRPEKTERAKAVIVNGIIGLIIIMCAWTVVRFVIESLVDATGGDTLALLSLSL